MGNKIRLKLNSSTGATRGLLRFASDENPKTQVLAAEKYTYDVLMSVNL